MYCFFKTAILDEHDHAIIFQTTESACDKWRAIGWELGFTSAELHFIVHEPGRYGDEDYYEAMLRRWLDWAPPNHTLPSFQSLVSALRAAGKERQANDLAAKYKVCGISVCVTPSAFVFSFLLHSYTIQQNLTNRTNE